MTFFTGSTVCANETRAMAHILGGSFVARVKDVMRKVDLLFSTNLTVLNFSQRHTRTVGWITALIQVVFHV